MPAGHHSDSDSTLLPLPKSAITWFGGIFTRLRGQFLLGCRTIAEWSLTINASTTERSSVCRHGDRVDDEWCMTRKLGSLLREAEGVARRKQLANVAFRKLSTVWFRRSRISLQLWLRLYESFVVPVLIYNMGTWGLTKAGLDRLDTYHRRHLCQIIGIHWPHRISNAALYRRCRCRPISEDVKSTRWRMFGHVLRMPLDSPAQQASTTISPTQESPRSEGARMLTPFCVNGIFNYYFLL